MNFYAISLLSIISIFMSCSMSGDTALNIKFSNSSVKTYSVKTAIGDQFIDNFELYNEAFSILGNQVDFSGKTTLTPSSFKIPFHGVTLSNGSHDINLGVPITDYPEAEWTDRINVDFCNPVLSYQIKSEIIPAIYNTVCISIDSYQRQTGYGPGFFWSTPVVEVTVPGYTDLDWPDIDYGGVVYVRKYLGDNKFMIEMSQILPTIKDSNNVTATPIEYYMFCSDYSTSGIILPGLEGFPNTINTADFGHILGGSTGTNLSMLLFPLEEVELEGETTLIFNIDINDILTVFDNNTPGDKSDDKLKLIEDYYKRFSIIYE